MKNLNLTPIPIYSTTKRFVQFGLTLSFVSTLISTHGALFDFSYRFSDFVVEGNGLVTGSLEGDRKGMFIDNVHNVTLSFDGVSVADPIFVGKRTGPGVSHPGTSPIVSFDVSKNDFIFANTDFLHGNGDYSVYFYMLPNWNGMVELPDEREAVGVVLGPKPYPSTPVFFAEDFPAPHAANWSLIKVPETGTAIVDFLGFGFVIGLSAIARRRASISFAKPVTALGA